MRKQLGIGIGVIAALLLTGLGFAMGKNMAEKSNAQLVSDVSYGIKEVDFVAENIQWKDFPGWKTVTFQLSGTVTVVAPEGTEVSLSEPEFADYGIGIQRTELYNPEAWKETGREQKKLSNGETVVSYDVISFEADGLEIEGTVTDGESSLEKNLTDVLAGNYYINVYFRDSKMDEAPSSSFAVGVILSGTQNLQVWSEKERQYAGRNLSVYLDAYKLSDTYMEGALSGKEKAAGISLIKGEDTLYHYTISNQGSEEWCYSGDLPALELWHDGVWIELESPFASNLSLLRIAPDEKQMINVPQQETFAPYLFPGLYRLVIYGQEGDYIATAPFEIQDKHELVYP